VLTAETEGWNGKVLTMDSSVRDPILTDHFWLNPLSQHFSQICVSDLILVNEHGDVVVGDEPINAAAFAIHSESTFLHTSLFLITVPHPEANLQQSTKLAQMSMQPAMRTQSTAKPGPPSVALWT
jgi:hypothetical protein